MNFTTAFTAALLLLTIGRAYAAPVVLSSSALELVNTSGETLADAKAEAQAYTEACRMPNNACLPMALSPYQLVPMFNTCGSTLPIVAWRSADELNLADHYVADLQKLSETRELFDCSGTVCLAVVPTTTPREEESSVTTLSVCSVHVVHGVPGAPTDCQEALKRHQRDGVFLRGQVGTSFINCRMGLRDFDAVFKGRARDVASVRNLVSDALRAKPFNLSVIEDGKALVGTRAHLPSEVLVGWREWITVRVDIDTRGVDAGTTIITTMLVSKQATASREAWTPPSEPQESTYLLALRNAIQRRGGIFITGSGQ